MTNIIYRRSLDQESDTAYPILTYTAASPHKHTH